jgi:hypothetical protein
VVRVRESLKTKDLLDRYNTCTLFAVTVQSDFSTSCALALKFPSLKLTVEKT